MQIVMVKVADLKPADYNPRMATKEQVAQLTASIKRHGFVEPIIVNDHPDRKNIVIGGHFRLRVAKDLGYTEVPCVYITCDLAKEQELNLRLNKNTGAWDNDLLAHFDTSLLTDVGFLEFELPENQLRKAEEEAENDDSSEAQSAKSRIVLTYPEAQFATIREKLKEQKAELQVKSYAQVIATLLDV